MEREPGKMKIYFFKFDHPDVKKNPAQVRIPAESEEDARFLFKTMYLDAQPLKLFKIQPVNTQDQHTKTDLNKVIIFADGVTHEKVIPPIFMQ
jgi:hypothetical protein